MAEYLSVIARMSPQERFDIMDLGLNPLNPDHIKMYRSGNIKVNMQENIEYIKSVVGHDIDMNKDLGHGRHSDRDPTDGQDPQKYMGGSTSAPASRKPDPKAVRQSMMEDMNDMVESSAMRSNDMSSKLLSISQKRQQPRMQQPAGNKLQEAIRVGKERSTNFHNAYIRCLQNPSTQGYMEIYKSLKLMLEQEQKLQGSQLLPNYKKGINEVTTNMYKKITNQIND